MTYTNEKPTAPGWYMVKPLIGEGEPRLLYIDGKLVPRSAKFAGPFIDVYKCRKCGHVCTTADMDADVCGPDLWTNHGCPKCHSWPLGLEDGWQKQ